MSLKLIKKRKKEYLLLVDYNCLQREQVIKEMKEMENNLVRLFKNHIGQENSISPREVFKYVFGIEPENVDVFKRGYWWNVLKGVIRNLRHKDRVFIINKGSKLFVLRTQEESNQFKKRVDNSIKIMKETKKKADEWVRRRRWMYIK